MRQNSTPKYLAQRTLLLALITALGGSQSVKSQELAANPIRVKSNEVIVPALVWNNRLWNSLRSSPSALAQSLATGDQSIWKSFVISGLEAKDFQVFEDGQEQATQSVELGDPPTSEVSDNLGRHYEYQGIGGGRWIYPDIPDDGRPHWMVSWPEYVVTYVPPRSTPGSCHKVVVKLKNHGGALVRTAGTYCNTSFAAADPLGATTFGMEMEKDLAADAEGSIALDVSATSFFRDPKRSLVYISAGFEPMSLSYRVKKDQPIETIGTDARIYDQEGATAVKLSDFDCCDYRNAFGAMDLEVGSTTTHAPCGYQTVVDLKPGRYRIRFVLSDAMHFGRRDVLIDVETHDEKNLALSDVGLSKRVRKARILRPEESTESSGAVAPLVAKGLDYTLEADSHFTTNDSLFFFFQIYEPQVSTTPRPSVHANLRIVDAKTNEVKTERLNFDVSSYINPGNPIIPIGDGIDIRNLSAGSYRLEVQASDSTGQSTPRHSATFSIQ